jgi:hypothetical protein
MELENLSWGEAYYGKDHSNSLTCPKAGCERSNFKLEYLFEEYRSSIAVGVRRGREGERPFVLTCKCPSCFTKYWFHINAEEAKRLAESHKEKRGE